jgi:uncharacterized protein YyaL (SSP411 family)
MATSTLIQYLDTTGADGDDIGLGVSNRRQVETFISAEAIVAGDVVALNLVTLALTAGERATQIRQASTNAARTAVVGVALSAAAGAGEKVQVCIAGVCEANVLAMAQGDVLTVTATAGSMDTITAATAPQVAVALETAAAPGKALVLVNCAGF